LASSIRKRTLAANKAASGTWAAVGAVGCGGVGEFPQPSNGEEDGGAAVGKETGRAIGGVFSMATAGGELLAGAFCASIAGGGLVAGAAAPAWHIRSSRLKVVPPTTRSTSRPSTTITKHGMLCTRYFAAKGRFLSILIRCTG
jgi:hypothetical protein